MAPSDLIRLRHMAEAARLAIDFCQGRERANMDTDAMLRLAVLHAVQIVGEAATKVSAKGRSEVPAIDWLVIVGMRNRLVHAYFDINADILWETVMHALPALLAKLHAADGVVEAGPPGR
ncbi:MAG: HepT-like ribonuclease domain-containing protein [Rubrivivax sp.]